MNQGLLGLTPDEMASDCGGSDEVADFARRERGGFGSVEGLVCVSVDGFAEMDVGSGGEAAEFVEVECPGWEDCGERSERG